MFKYNSSSNEVNLFCSQINIKSLNSKCHEISWLLCSKRGKGVNVPNAISAYLFNTPGVSDSIWIGLDLNI